MARIELQDIAHAYTPNPQRPEDYALRRLDHIWEDGGAYALLGPSGCGKSTLLNIISGLLHPSQGQVVFDGVDVTELPTKARNIAQVFQFPVIYDTMTVYDNLAFPLKNRGFSPSAVQERVGEIAEMLDLTPVLKRRAQNLTADAKQTISLGRGLVRSDVAAILFDEPLTVIDPQLKWHLRRKLKQIHERFKLTLVYVTHDQNEALTFADKVVVMSAGEVVQLGTPQELFEKPAHTFVGHFIGSPGMNFMPCGVEGDNAVVANQRIPLPPGTGTRAKATGGELTLGVRPEFLRLSRQLSPGAVDVAVTGREDLGNFQIVDVALGPYTLKVKVPEDQIIGDDQHYLHFVPEMTQLYCDDRLVGG